MLRRLCRSYQWAVYAAAVSWSREHLSDWFTFEDKYVLEAEVRPKKRRDRGLQRAWDRFKWVNVSCSSGTHVE